MPHHPTTTADLARAATRPDQLRTHVFYRERGELFQEGLQGALLLREIVDWLLARGLSPTAYVRHVYSASPVE